MEGGGGGGGDGACEGASVDMMGDILRKISGAITNKLESGDLSNDDIIAETVKMMNNVKGFL
jgi:hypothetical protein